MCKGQSSRGSMMTNRKFLCLVVALFLWFASQVLELAMAFLDKSKQPGVE
jgi:hypothetical protein